MFARIGLAALVPLIFVTLTGAADETYTLKFKDLGKGETGSYEVTDANEIFVRVLNSDNVSVLDKKLKLGVKLVFWESVLEKPEGKPASRTRRGYGEARITLENKTTPLPVEGKRVTINRKDGKVTYKIEGVKEIDGKQADVLEKEFDDPVNLTPFLPDKPVKVKQTWPFDARPLASELARSIRDMTFDVAKAQGIARLNEVYTKEGRRFAKITNHVEIPIKAILIPGKRIPLDKNDKVVLQVNFDCCIDGTAHLGSYKAAPYISTTATISEKGQKATIKIVVSGERNVTFRELKK